MRFIEKLIIIFVIFSVLLIFLQFTQILPGWITDFQKILMNNIIIFVSMAVMIWVAVQ